MRIETSSMLVGSSARTTFGSTAEHARDRDALALAAGELVRVLRRDLLRRDEPDRAQQLVHALARPAPEGTTLWMRSGRSTWWRTVLTGLSESNGSWKMICTCER